MEYSKEEIQQKFEQLGLSVHVSEPKPRIDPDWLGIKYVLTFSKGNHSSQQVELEYTLGIGHVKYKEAFTAHLTENEKNILWHKRKNPYVKFKPEAREYEASLAVKLAKAQKVQPNPAEVLICYCREALEAIETTFEDWASNFGYDTDSRKAENIYNSSRDSYSKLLKIMSRKEIEEFSQIEL